MANLITLEDYKDAKGLQNVKDDTRIESLISSVSQLVKTYCGNTIIDFYSSSKTEYFNVDWDTHIVQLTESPVNSVSVVEKRDSVTSSYTTVPTTEYYLDQTTDSILYVTGSAYKNWPRGAGAVRVTYSAGYLNTPADLKLAVIDLVTYYLKDEYKERRTLGGASIQNQGSSTLTDNVGFPDHIKRILDMYKNF
jgi:hypothetical protein